MKKLFLVLALASFMFVFPMHGSAGIIGNVTLTETADFPAGRVSFNGGASYGDFFLDYAVSLNGGAYGEAFCVENMPGPGSTSTPYTLLSIDGSLAGFGLRKQPRKSPFGKLSAMASAIST